MDSIVAASPQKQGYYTEDILTLANPLQLCGSIPSNRHNPHDAGWRCVPYDPMLQVSRDPMPNHQHYPPVPKPVVLHADATIQRPVVVQVCEDSYESEATSSSTSSLSLDPLDLEEDCKSLENPDPCCDSEFRRTAHWNPKARHVVKREVKGRRNKNATVPCEDYRRFSSRPRTKTEFFGVPGKKKKDKKHRKEGRSSRCWEMDKRAVVEKTSPRPDLKVAEAKEISPVSSPPEGEGGEVTEAAAKETVEETVEEAVTLDSEANEAEAEAMKKMQDSYPIGRMMWGKLLGYDWWPGLIVSHSREEPRRGKVESTQDEEGDVESNEGGGKVWLKWFGEKQLSNMVADKLTPFEDFKDVYSPLAMKGLYRKAVFTALKVAAKRCKVALSSSSSDKEPRWMISEKNPQPTLIRESEDTPASPDQSAPVPTDQVDDSPPARPQKRKRGSKKKVARMATKRNKGVLYFTAYEHELLEWACNRFDPPGPGGLWPSPEDQEQINVVPFDDDEGDSDSDYDGEEPPKKKSKVMLVHVKKKVQFENVREGKVQISDVCIGCGELKVHIFHPLFEGGFCVDCKNQFMECAYMFDDDGTQMYCCICCGGDEVYLCDAPNCAKVYCGPCIEKLCGETELKRVRASDSWVCYMCSPEPKVGLMCKRPDWDLKLRELFMSDHDKEFEPYPIYPPIPPDERRPLRVLGLFDGVGTGSLVLKELGFEISKYVASEVDMDAINVCRVNHTGIINVGDIEYLSEKKVRSWGEFDLVYGGSPCNDLSIVNPARKGIYRESRGTGKLFFEFFRLLSYVKPSPQEDRPFFWLFENVVSMRMEDKSVISRFLQCNPVVIDAKEISPAHRARYFWGNIPGMNRPAKPLPADRLTLQECLDPNCSRKAQFTKLRTITTKMNSIKQGKKAVLPVWVEDQDEGDVLWCTEMERLFGFPEHYTDVSNLGRSGRQRLLGKAWSVPVIRHLLSPLKAYFKASTKVDTPHEAIPPAVETLAIEKADPPK